MIDLEKISLNFQNWVESRVGKVHPEQGLTNVNVNGTPFICFACGGVVKEGDPSILLSSSLDDLILHTKEAFKNYIIDSSYYSYKIPTLYWRTYPKITETEIEGFSFYSIKFRMCIDEAPK